MKKVYSSNTDNLFHWASDPLTQPSLTRIARKVGSHWHGGELAAGADECDLGDVVPSSDDTEVEIYLPPMSYLATTQATPRYTVFGTHGRVAHQSPKNLHPYQEEHVDINETQESSYINASGGEFTLWCAEHSRMQAELRMEYQPPPQHDDQASPDALCDVPHSTTSRAIATQSTYRITPTKARKKAAELSRQLAALSSLERRLRRKHRRMVLLSLGQHT